MRMIRITKLKIKELVNKYYKKYIPIYYNRTNIRILNKIFNYESITDFEYNTFKDTTDKLFNNIKTEMANGLQYDEVILLQNRSNEIIQSAYDSKLSFFEINALYNHIKFFKSIIKDHS